METPLWLTYLRSNPEALSSFWQWITLAQDEIKDRIMTAVEKDETVEAKLLRGELRALDKLRNLSSIADRESQAYAEHQHAKGNISVRSLRSIKG